MSDPNTDASSTDPAQNEHTEDTDSTPEENASGVSPTTEEDTASGGAPEPPD